MFFVDDGCIYNGDFQHVEKHFFPPLCIAMLIYKICCFLISSVHATQIDCVEFYSNWFVNKFVRVIPLSISSLASHFLFKSSSTVNGRQQVDLSLVDPIDK